MRKSAIILVLSLSLFTSAGCRTAQLKQDHQDIRDALIDLGEKQVLNNVARLVAGDAFVHVDYGTITGDVTTTTEATIAGGKDDTDNAFGGPVTASSGIGNIKTTYSFTGKQGNVVKLALAGTPARDAAVYETYFAFAAEAQTAGMEVPEAGTGKSLQPSTRRAPSIGIDLLEQPKDAGPTKPSPFAKFFKSDPNSKTRSEQILLHSKTPPATKPHKLTQVGDEYFWIPDTAFAKRRFVQLYAETTLRDRPKATYSEEIADQLNLLRLRQQDR